MDGSREVAIDAGMLQDWFPQWPCSSMRGCSEGILATFDARGDLVDLTDLGGGEVGTDEVAGDELTALVAWLDRAAGVTS